jgi:hypothetical protein
MNASPQFADHVRHYERHYDLSRGSRNTVHPDGPLPYTTVHKFGAFTEDGQGAYVIHTRSPSAHTVFDGDPNITEPDGQIPMIGTRQRGENKISMAFASKGHEYLISGLLGRALTHAQRAYGQAPEADDDLSPDSARMVQRLVDKGVIRAPKQGHRHDADQPADRVAVTNDYSKDDTARLVKDSSVYPGTEARPEDVQEGEQVMRRTLREPRDSPKYDQLQMFATPAEIANWNSGDYHGKKMSEAVNHMDGSKIDSLQRGTTAQGGIRDAVEVYHGADGRTLGNGHHRAAVAMRTGQLLPVIHSKQYWGKPA